MKLSHLFWFGASGLVTLTFSSLALLNFSHENRLRSYENLLDLRAVNWVGENLAGANFSGQVFREANLSEASLRKANLERADFSGAATYLIDTDLREANLTSASLLYTHAIRADFSGATLHNTDLSHANLSGSRFKNASLEGAILVGAKLVGADLSQLKHPPTYLDRADLTDTGIVEFPQTRLCNTTMTNGSISKQGCFWISSGLQQAAEAKNWLWMEQENNFLFQEAVIPADALKLKQVIEDITPEQIQSMPCDDLKTLDQLWQSASNRRFGFGIQREIWESPQVNQDYTRFAETVGWKQNGTWLKFEDLRQKTSANEFLPIAHFPWHGWQIKEPTPEDPSRFRREGFGEWMKRLKTCDI